MAAVENLYTVTFVTEFFPFVIKIYGGVANLRPAFTVVSSWNFAATFAKINKALKNVVSRHAFCFQEQKDRDPFPRSLTVFSSFFTHMSCRLLFSLRLQY